MTESRRFLKSLGIALVALTMTVQVAEIARAAMFVRGDEGIMWLIVEYPEEKSFTLMHRRAQWSADELQSHGRFNGTLLRAGMAAGGESLIIIQQDNSVLRFQLKTDPRTGGDMAVSQVIPPLLPAVEVRSITMAGENVWVLVRVRDEATLRAIDLPKSAIPPEIDAEGKPLPNATGDREVERLPFDPDEMLPTYRLLKLAGSRWLRTAIPQDWPDQWQRDGRAFLVTRRPTDESPALLIPFDADDKPLDDTVAVYEKNKEGDWNRTDHITGIDFDLSPIIVQQQIVLGRKIYNPKQVEVALFMLKAPQEGDDRNIVELSSLVIDRPAEPNEFGIVSFDQAMTLVARDEEQRAHWTSRDIRDDIRQQQTELHIVQPNILDDQAGVLLLIGVVSMATVIFLAFWKRDPKANELNLPKPWILGDLIRRLMAALIDLMPGLLVTILIYDKSPIEVLQSWPLDASFKELAAPLLLIAVFVWLTMMFELFTARTPGKMVMGLRVMTLDGEPPSLWAILGRNFLKLFDLIAPPMLLLMFISPHRQRLGDLVARTVVVQQQVESNDDNAIDDDE